MCLQNYSWNWKKGKKMALEHHSNPEHYRRLGTSNLSQQGALIASLKHAHCRPTSQISLLP